MAKRQAKKANSPAPQQQVRRPYKGTKIVRSTLSKEISSGNVFNVSGAGSIQTKVDFASQQGRRAGELFGLGSGPKATSIVNSAVARRRSRHAVLTNPYAKRFLEVYTANVVGKGFRMLSQAPDDAFKKQVDELWEEWVDEVDLNGQMNFGAFQAAAFRSYAEGGDCFIRLRNRRPEDELSVPLQLQIFESEQVPVSKNERVGGNTIIGGIEFDQLGQIVAYHMHPNHPGDFTLEVRTNNTTAGTMDTVRIPSSEIIHLHDMRRPGEVRGLPLIATALIALNDLDRYMDAELVRKKAAALIGGFIRRPADMMGLNPFITGEEDDDEDIHIETMEPGTFPVLPPGFEVSFSDPNDVGNNFKDFMRQQLLMVAAALNLTYEQLTGDYNGANDRTVRAALLETKRIMMQYQNLILKHQLCRGVFKRWMRQALLSGALVLPASMTLRQAMKARWIADPWEYLNPLQETQNHLLEVRGGFTSKDEIIIQRGGIPEQVHQHLVQEREREKDDDLVLTTNAGVVSNAGVAHSSDPSLILSGEVPPPQPPGQAPQNNGNDNAQEPED